MLMLKNYKIKHYLILESSHIFSKNEEKKYIYHGEVISAKSRNYVSSTIGSISFF